MKILFITPSYKPAYIYGGPVVVIALLAESLVKLGHSVTVYTTTANGKMELEIKSGERQLVNGVEVFYFHRISGDHTHMSPSLWRKLFLSVYEFNVVHIHSWWNILILVSAFICKMRNISPVLSPHGMFSNYILDTNNSFIKTIMQKVIGKKLLKKSILHVSTDMEWEESQKIIPNWQGRVIPNMVKLSKKIYPRHENPVFTIGFLSRIDPKKGLDLLIKALADVRFKYKLLIAGDGDAEYVKYLKNLSQQMGNFINIEWVGWKNGDEKFEFLADIDLFALTSHSENFAIVVIEALSVGTPVLISDQIGLIKFVEYNGYGWTTSIEVESIRNVLTAAYEDNLKIQNINFNSAFKIKTAFNPSKLAKEYVDFYDEFHNNREKVINN